MSSSFVISTGHRCLFHIASVILTRQSSVIVLNQGWSTHPLTRL
jgi:hypothetical protein